MLLRWSCYCAELADHRRGDDSAQARAEANGLLDLLTPVAKAWPSEWGLAANDLAIRDLRRIWICA